MLSQPSKVPFFKSESFYWSYFVHSVKHSHLHHATLLQTKTQLNYLFKSCYFTTVIVTVMLIVIVTYIEFEFFYFLFGGLSLLGLLLLGHINVF
jgi:hypothetical protein